MSQIKLIKFYISFLLLLGGVGIFIAPSVVLANYSETPPERSASFNADVSALKAKAESKGKIPIIVRLKVGFVPEGSFNESSTSTADNSINKVDAQRQKIKEVSSKVIELLSYSDTSSSTEADEIKSNGVITYQMLPYIALKASSDEINLLSNSEDVVSIYEDTLMKGALSESVPFIDGHLAHSMGYIATGQVIVVIDTGVKTDHEFFAGKLVSEACYSGGGGTSLCPGGVTESTAQGSGMDCSLNIGGCGHGTHVAGVALGFNGQLTGVAKDAKLIAIKTASLSNNSILHAGADIAKALERVLQLSSSFEIAAVNLSIQDGVFTGTCDNYNVAVTDAVNQLHAAGIATIVASGNKYSTNGMSFPACISNAISVGNSTDAIYNHGNVTYQADDVWIDSNINALTDLLAPGTAIVSSSSDSTNSYASRWGTSESAPHVAGTFAILRSKNPNVTIATMLNALQATGVAVEDQRSARNNIPAGMHTVKRIDIDNALAVINPLAPTPISPIGTTTSVRPTFTWEAVTGATKYSLVADDSAVLTWPWVVYDNDVTPAEAGCESGTGTCSYTSTVDFSPGAAVWRIAVVVPTGPWPESALTGFTVEGGALPSITLPSANSILGGATHPFNWLANGTNVTEWWVYAGSSVGAKNYYNSSSLGTATNTVITGLPTNGSLVHVRLWYKEGGQWKYIDTSYTAASITATLPEITSPTAGAVLTSSSQLFSWVNNSTNVSQWWMYIGSSVGAKNYLDSGSLAAATNTNVSGLPTDGSTVYVRLWYWTGSWEFVDSTYTAATIATSLPEITTPTSSSILSGSSQTFNWQSNSTSVSEWWVYAGSTIGSRNYHDSNSLGLATSTTITTLPVNGSIVYVRLWYKQGSWKYVDFSYTAAFEIGNLMPLSPSGEFNINQPLFTKIVKNAELQSSSVQKHDELEVQQTWSAVTESSTDSA